MEAVKTTQTVANLLHFNWRKRTTQNKSSLLISKQFSRIIENKKTYSSSHLSYAALALMTIHVINSSKCCFQSGNEVIFCKGESAAWQHDHKQEDHSSGKSRATLSAFQPHRGINPRSSRFLRETKYPVRGGSRGCGAYIPHQPFSTISFFSMNAMFRNF